MITEMTRKIKKAKALKILKYTAAALAAAAFVVLTVVLAPKIMSLRDPAVQEAVRDKIESLGMKGVVAVFFLQVLQVVLAFLPGEPVELLIGFLYGTFGGLVLCVSGIAAGTALVFSCARLFGKRYISTFIDSELHKKFAFLRDPLRRDAMFFLLMLIPGTPKDALTYFAPLTKIPLARFLLISCTARIPSIVSSTFIGSKISDGNLVVSALIFALTGALGLGGIIIYNRVIAQNRVKYGKNEKI